MAQALSNFLEKYVEGYLFEDLRTMKNAQPAQGKDAGALGYPILMTAFAGIELFGALLSTTKFEPYHGGEYFKAFWTKHLYPIEPRRAAGEPLYQLIRNGLAHLFITKGDNLVFKNAPQSHLVRTPDGLICIDATQLADDLERCYKSKAKDLILSGASAARLSEIENNYRRQAENCIKSLQKLPILPMAINTDVASKSVPPSGIMVTSSSSSSWFK